MRRLYNHSYFFGHEYIDYLSDRLALDRNFRRRLHTLRSFMDPLRHRRLLEVGCAYGLFLNVAREDFGAVTGLDISEDAVSYAQTRLGLDVRLGDLLTTDLGAVFDVTCMWDTIEHLPSPDRHVAAASRHMDTGALLAITTGDIGSLVARVRRGRWRLIHPPTHLHYFSRRTLARMLDRLGFDVVYFGHCGFVRTLGSTIGTLVRDRPALAPVSRWVIASRLDKLQLYVNLYDIMYVIAVKRAG